MAKIQFLGRVLPEFIKVTVPPRDVLWKEADTQAQTTMRLRIFESKINVECDSNIYSKDNLAPLYMRAFDLARASINLVAFASGEGLSLILDTVICDDGMPLPMSPRVHSLAPLCTTYRVNEADDSALNEIYNIVLSDPTLFLALNDLVLAITLPHVAPMTCGRAMDGLKNIIATPDTTPVQAWEQMRNTLHIDKDFLQFITAMSAGPRHARPGHIPGETVREICRRSWIIMNRYLEYRKRGSQPLPVSEFPLLIA
jgi:hypothetical protein